MITYFGRFTSYVPETPPEGFPPAMIPLVGWIHNEAGEDMYELRKRLPPDQLYVIVEDDFTVRIVHDDPHAVWPELGGHLYAVSTAISRDPADHRVSFFDPATATLIPKPQPLPVITRRQLRLWLVRNGVSLATVEAAIGALPEPDRTEAQIEWDGAEFEFSNPLVPRIGSAIGMTVEEMQQGWREAALI